MSAGTLEARDEPGTATCENARLEDIVINVCKKKQMTNMRASGSDEALKLLGRDEEVFAPLDLIGTWTTRGMRHRDHQIRSLRHQRTHKAGLAGP